VQVLVSKRLWRIWTFSKSASWHGLAIQMYL
jgi:hypothetical protein